jgi:hypothetical protein
MILLFETTDEEVKKGDPDAETYCRLESSLVLVMKLVDWLWFFSLSVC